MNDIEAARAADAVFAKNRLIHYCKVEGIDMLPFDSLIEVAANLTGTALVR
jgi:2-hydroxy-3-keto-5-methylthiopentenyl-1-phosphate phosphatase